MKEINNLIYTLEINYENAPGLKTSIYTQFHENGLEIKSIKVGDVCVTEETINGRVLSGRYENLDGYCGYRYDYQNGENLLNINSAVPIHTASALINSTKMKPEFLSAKLVLSSVSRNDYRVLILNKGKLNVVKTVSAENENSEPCSIQENLELMKFVGEKSFIIKNKKTAYQIGDASIIEDTQQQTDNVIKSELHELFEIFSQCPQSYKDLIMFKESAQKPADASENEGKTF